MTFIPRGGRGGGGVTAGQDSLRIMNIKPLDIV